MSLLDKDMTEDIARGIRTMHEAAKGGIETAAARGATRLRSGAKTRKSAATREKIMAAATELMVERGNTDFQMSEVSARCQMSKGALYYYFADKGALVQAIFDASIDDLVDQIEGAVAKASSAMESIEGIARVLARGMRPRSPLALAMGRANDAVKLAYLDQDGLSQIDGLDLRCLTEFKRSSNGAVEVKLTDRVAVLEKLLEQQKAEEDGLGAFLEAMDRLAAPEGVCSQR